MTSMGIFKVTAKSPFVKCLAETNTMLDVLSLSANSSTPEVGEESQETTGPQQSHAPCLHKGL